MSDADGNTIGPGNVVSGNGTNGVRLRTGASGNVVKGNTIGLNAAITAAIPNADGVQINDGAADNTIGGPGPDRNVISGNSNSGVLIVDAQTSGNVVQGNFIGSNASASAAFPNGGDGVAIQAGANANVIGGTAAGTKNVIAFNVARGVSIDSGTGNSVLGNTISFNGNLGIDLGPAGVTPNDPGDPDPGANLLQNFPVLSSALLLDTASTQVQGSLNSIRVLELSDRVLLDDPLRRLGQRARPAVPGSRGPDDRFRRQRGLRRGSDVGRAGPVDHGDGDGRRGQHVGVLGVPRRSGPVGLLDRAVVGPRGRRRRRSRSRG